MQTDTVSKVKSRTRGVRNGLQMPVIRSSTSATIGMTREIAVLQTKRILIHAQRLLKRPRLMTGIVVTRSSKSRSEHQNRSHSSSNRTSQSKVKGETHRRSPRNSHLRTQPHPSALTISHSDLITDTIVRWRIEGRG